MQTEKLSYLISALQRIYGLPIDMIKPGMTTPELMAVAFSQGRVADVDPEGTLALRQSIAREGKAGSMIDD